MATYDPKREQAATGLEQLASLIRAQSWSTSGGASLPPTQAATLRMLASEEELTAKKIAERLGVSAASLSDSLKAMEAKGWIQREPDPADKRALIIRLTRGGRVVARQLRHPVNGVAGLLQSMDERDIGALLRVTQLLVLEAQRQGLATGARTCLGCRYFRSNAGGTPRNPHYCDFVSQPFGDPELRADCQDQTPADEPHLAESLKHFRRPVPP